MKELFGTTLLFVLIALSLYGQDKILVSVSPEIGTEVDREERDKYNWFPDVPNFISARFYYLADGTYEVEIQFFQNGQVNEQHRVITAESFQKDYQNTLIVEKIEETPVERGRRRRPVSYESNKKHNVNLRLKNSVVKDVVIKGITADSIMTEKTIKKGGEIHVTHSNYAIADIENISVIRNTNVAGILGIGVAPGVIAGFFSYATGNDEGWLWSHTAEEKGKAAFFLGEIIGLSVSGTIAAMKSVDHDYVISDLSYAQKEERLAQFINQGLRKKTNVRFGPWVGVYYFRNYLNNTITFPGARLSLCFTPRSRMEIMYGYSQGWSLKKKDFEIQQRSESREFTDFYLLKVGFRIDESYHRNLNTFLAWGWGVLFKRYKYQDYYYDYYNNYYDNGEDIQMNPDIIMNIELGIEHHFYSWLSAEARIGIVENFDYGLHPMVQVGIHFGQFY